MQEQRFCKSIYKLKPIASRRRGRPKWREGDILKDHKMMKVNNMMNVMNGREILRRPKLSLQSLLKKNKLWLQRFILWKISYVLNFRFFSGLAVESV